MTTRKNGSHSVVWYHSVEYPKADHLINRWVVGRAKCLRVARQPLSPAERKKERERAPAGACPQAWGKRERERERERKRKERTVHAASHAFCLACVLFYLASSKHLVGRGRAGARGYSPCFYPHEEKRERERQREREREKKERERERWGQLSSSGAHSS